MADAKTPDIEGIVVEKTPKNPFLTELARLVKDNTRIDPELFSKYDVKRGLRNSDGTGVLVGLTQIGDVHGYIINEKEKVAVPGKLRYRGIEIEDLVAGFQKEKRHGYEETAYLLLFGELPKKKDLTKFTHLLGRQRKLPDGLRKI
jgi:citrate synthase